MNAEQVNRDERTVAVENAGYSWSYQLLAFGVLALAAYRSLVLHQATWDMLAMVVLSGVVNIVYQGWKKTLYPRWAMMMAFVVALAGLIAAGMMVTRSVQ